MIIFYSIGSCWSLWKLFGRRYDAEKGKSYFTYIFTWPKGLLVKHFLRVVRKLKFKKVLNINQRIVLQIYRSNSVWDYGHLFPDPVQDWIGSRSGKLQHFLRPQLLKSKWPICVTFNLVVPNYIKPLKLTLLEKLPYYLYFSYNMVR